MASSSSTSCDQIPISYDLPPRLKQFLQNASNHVSIKLDNTNFSLWRTQVVIVLKACKQFIIFIALSHLLWQQFLFMAQKLLVQITCFGKTLMKTYSHVCLLQCPLLFSLKSCISPSMLRYERFLKKGSTTLATLMFIS